jgi:hypothetical protein
MDVAPPSTPLVMTRSADKGPTSLLFDFGIVDVLSVALDDRAMLKTPAVRPPGLPPISSKALAAIYFLDGQVWTCFVCLIELYGEAAT